MVKVLRQSYRTYFQTSLFIKEPLNWNKLDHRPTFGKILTKGPSCNKIAASRCFITNSVWNTWPNSHTLCHFVTCRWIYSEVVHPNAIYHGFLWATVFLLNYFPFFLGTHWNLQRDPHFIILLLLFNVVMNFIQCWCWTILEKLFFISLPWDCFFNKSSFTFRKKLPNFSEVEHKHPYKDTTWTQ